MSVQLVCGLIAFSAAFLTWWKAKFKCPIYIHVLAALATGLGILMLPGIETEILNNNDGWFQEDWQIVMMMPALVYGAFILHGGRIYSNKESQKDKKNR